MPQYQGVWTLPVAARLQSTQQWATDPLYRNTTLLLQTDNAANGAQNNTFLDSSTNNFTITRAGNTTQGSFTPYSLQPGAWSNYFDGDGDYLTTTSSAAFQFGTGDFTMECWINMAAGTNLTSYWRSFLSCAGEAVYTNGVTLYIGDAGAGSSVAGEVAVIIGNDTVRIYGGQDIRGLGWVHVALTRSGTTLRLFVNGAQRSSTTNSSNINATSYGAQIGLSYTVQNNGFIGYISNVRVIKGTALYTSNFTPSNLPLTTITNTSLLTCQSNRFVDNSTLNFTLTANGTPSVQAFSPFAPQYQYTPSVTGGSGYFDGSDWLRTSSDITLDADFCLEAYLYITSLSGTKILFSSISSTPGTNVQIPRIQTNGGVYVYINGTELNAGSTATDLGTLNQWNHFAMTRSGSTVRAFVNGVQIWSTTYSSSFGVGVVGQFYLSGSPYAGYDYAGYMASVRVVKGSAVYTSNFTPPTAPLTAITNTQLLLNFTNAGIYDGTLKNNLETVGNAQVSTSVVKYGTGSMAFDGTGDYLTSNAASGLALYSISAIESFTIEMWVNRSGNGAGGTTGYDAILGSNTGTTSILGVYVERSTLKIGFYIGGALYLTSSTISNSAWTHIAVARSFGNLQIFINGVSGYSAANAGASTLVNPLYIGQDGTGAGGNNNFNGYIDDLRITKGIARYTANFTPPTVALPRQ